MASKNKINKQEITEVSYPLIMDKPQCANLLQIGLRTLERYVAEGRIPFIRVTKKVLRFHRDDVLEALRK